MKNSNYYRRKKKRQKVSQVKNYSWLTRLLLSIILILISLIITNFSPSLKQKYVTDLLNKNMSFTTLNKLYKKFIGNNKEPKEDLVANIDIKQPTYEKVDNSFKFTVGNEYPVPLLQSGIIVYLGDKDNLGNTAIIQGNDGIDIWYSNIDVTEYSLYDYVTKGSIIGVNRNDYYMLTIMKDDQSLDYEDYLA